MGPFNLLKMRVNELVIIEVTKALHPDLDGLELTEAQNNVAITMLESGIHENIRELATSILDEIRKQQGNS